jgi:hypothetical protein
LFGGSKESDGDTRDAAAPRVGIAAFGKSSPNCRIGTCSSQQGYKSETKGTLLSPAALLKKTKEQLAKDHDECVFEKL